MIKVGQTGKLVKGNVLDISPRYMEQLLKRYDSQLYLVWNPKKAYGHGCWEVRRHPNEKTAVYQGTFMGMNLHTVEYKENNLIHHVLDVPTLGHHVIAKLASIDTFYTKTWAADLEYKEAKLLEKSDSQSRVLLKEWSKEFKSEIKDFKEFVLSGNNPAQIAHYWNKNK